MRKGILPYFLWFLNWERINILAGWKQIQNNSIFFSPIFFLWIHYFPFLSYSLLFQLSCMTLALRNFVISWIYQNPPLQVIKCQSSYLPQMTSDIKSKVTLFSPTLKVEKGKVHSFLWSEFILVIYDIFVISWRYWKTPRKSQNDKKLISPSNDVESKK